MNNVIFWFMGQNVKDVFFVDWSYNCSVKDVISVDGKNFSLFPFFWRGRFGNKLIKTKHGQMLAREPLFENVFCVDMK